MAKLLERRHPELVVSDMKKALRVGKVLVDWSQNDDHKTTICVYSLRARERPTGFNSAEVGRSRKVPEEGRLQSCRDLRVGPGAGEGEEVRRSLRAGVEVKADAAEGGSAANSFRVGGRSRSQAASRSGAAAEAESAKAGAVRRKQQRRAWQKKISELFFQRVILSEHSPGV